MTLEALLAALSAIALLIVGLALRRIEVRLAHIEELRINDARHDARAEAVAFRLQTVEAESRKWDVAITALTGLSAQLAQALERAGRREERADLTR